jgi:GT2 family glycosyltransferase
MIDSNPITFCISTYNNLNYLKLAITSVRENSYYKEAPFIIHAENCNDGTDEWLNENAHKYKLDVWVDKNEKPIGIGGGMNFCANKVETKYIMFLHSDFYVTKDWDKACYDEIQKHIEPTWVFSHRVEPNMFNSDQRPGTVIVPQDIFGAYYDDFNAIYFKEWAKEFIETNDFIIPKAEGVSGLISKQNWDEVGGNDPIYAPTSWEDMDLFLRMLYKGYKFIITSKSILWNFGESGSHRLE